LLSLLLWGVVVVFSFRCHPEERSDEERFSIARFSSDESLRFFLLLYLVLIPIPLFASSAPSVSS